MKTESILAPTLSRDVDIYLRLITKEDGRAILDRAARACDGYRVEHPNFPRIEFERDKDNHIDINLRAPTPEKGERIAVVDGEETAVLSNAQIMTGKLKGRGMSSPGRDVFDIAVCRRADPEALEIAVNAVDDVTLDGILTVFGYPKFTQLTGHFADFGRISRFPCL